MKTGDKVTYNHKFVKSAQLPPELANRRGTVTEVKGLKPTLQYVRVLWDDDGQVTGCLSSNLARIKDGTILDVTE